MWWVVKTTPRVLYSHERTSTHCMGALSGTKAVIYIYIYIYIYIFTAIVLSPGGSGYFTCKQNMKLVTTRFKTGGLHEKHVVATWNVGNHLSVWL